MLRKTGLALLLAAWSTALLAWDLGIRGFAKESKVLSSSNPEAFGRSGAPQQVSAGLYLPRTRGPHAAVIVVPGSDGLSAAKEGAYAERLLAAGMAVLVVDPLRSRGLDNLLQDPAAVNDAAMVEDVRAALDLLAKDDRIDASRIGGLGTSRGAAVLTAAAARLGPEKFRALALPYPFCSLAWRFAPASQPLRILMLLAGREDEVSNDACFDLAKLHVADNVALTIEVIAGAYHGFDAGIAGAAVPTINVRNCPLIPVRSDGTFQTDVIAGAPPAAATMPELLNAMRSCMGEGAHWGETPGSRAHALARVTGFLADALKRAPSSRQSRQLSGRTP